MASAFLGTLRRRNAHRLRAFDNVNGLMAWFQPGGSLGLFGHAIRRDANASGRAAGARTVILTRFLFSPIPFLSGRGEAFVATRSRGRHSDLASRCIARRQSPPSFFPQANNRHVPGVGTESGKSGGTLRRSGLTPYPRRTARNGYISRTATPKPDAKTPGVGPERLHHGRLIRLRCG